MEKKKEMTIIKRTAIALLDELKEKVVNDCSDEDVVSTMSKFHPQVNGYFKQDDFVTADMAMRILHLGQNRNKFFRLVKEYGIENHKISNQNIGYLKKDIYKLSTILEDEVNYPQTKDL